MNLPQQVKDADKQYSLIKILAIWASVAVPMGLITWVIMPYLIPRVDVNPGLIRMPLIVLGLVWQGVVSLSFSDERLFPLRGTI